MIILNYYFDEFGSTLDVPNIFYLTYYILKQVEKGKVITYGDIAELLGDKIASRAVGRLMAINKHPDEIPCYKVIHSDGTVGKYSGPGGINEKIRRLRNDGVKVSNDFRIELKKYRTSIDRIKTPRYLGSLKRIQNYLSHLVKLDKKIEVDRIKYAVSTDVSYIDGYPDIGIGGAVLMNCRENCNVEHVSITFLPVLFPYIPTYLAFRELPVVLSSINSLVKESGKKPDVFLFDGQGVLHPRGFGLASHAGLLLNKPSIGIAKSRLVGKESHKKIIIDGKEIVKVSIDDKRYGYKVYPENKPRKSIFVSPGNLIDHETALEIVLKFKWVKDKFYPMNVAHKIVYEIRKKIVSMVNGKFNL